MRRLAPWLLTLIALGGLAATLWGYRQRGQQIADLQTRINQSSQRNGERVSELKAKIADAAKARVAARRAMADARPAAPVRESNGLGFNADDMRKDPAYAALWHKQQLRNVQREYGEAIAALKLPPDQVAKLRELLVGREEARADAREAGQAAGLTARDLNLATTQAAGAVNDEIKGVIGADAFQQLQTAPQTGGFKLMIENTVAIDLNGAGTPLTPDQESELVAAYAQAARPPPGAGKGSAWITPNPDTGLAPSDQATLDAAGKVFGPDQMAIIKENLLEQRQQQQYFRQRAAARAAGG
jgi:hypothetical protein